MKDPYICYRCGYETNHKQHIKRHLYSLSKQCPGIKHNEPLTDEIKECILENRIYHPPPPPPIQTPEPTPTPQQIFNQNFNNYNQINAIITKMDPLEKLESIMTHKNTSSLMSLEDSIEQRYEYQITRLENRSFKDYFLEHHNLIDVIDHVTQSDSLDNLNIIHDTVCDKLKIYNGAKWDSLLFDQGACELIRCIQSAYLDVYETYLIERYISTPSLRIKDMLTTYYKFISSFDLEPSINDETEEELYDLYKSIESNIKMSEVKRVKKEVHDIIKNNNRKSVIDLNKAVMELMQVDEDFKNKVIQRMQFMI